MVILLPCIYNSETKAGNLLLFKEKQHVCTSDFQKYYCVFKLRRAITWSVKLHLRSPNSKYLQLELLGFFLFFYSCLFSSCPSYPCYLQDQNLQQKNCCVTQPAHASGGYYCFSLTLLSGFKCAIADHRKINKPKIHLRLIACLVIYLYLGAISPLFKTEMCLPRGQIHTPCYR